MLTFYKLINSIEIKLCRPNKTYLLVEFRLQAILLYLEKTQKLKTNKQTNKLLRGPQGVNILISWCDFCDENFTHIFYDSYVPRATTMKNKHIILPDFLKFQCSFQIEKVGKNRYFKSNFYRVSISHP